MWRVLSPWQDATQRGGDKGCKGGGVVVGRPERRRGGGAEGGDGGASSYIFMTT